MEKKKKVYPISCYGKHLCLVPDFNMWLIFLFLIRPYLVLIISVANRTDRLQLINLLYADRMMMWLGLLAGIPAVLVVYAWMKRQPNATKFVRYIWHRGKLLLAISAIFNIGIVVLPMLLIDAHNFSIHGLWQLVVSALVLGVVLKSDYIRDCFLDFPTDSDVRGK